MDEFTSEHPFIDQDFSDWVYESNTIGMSAERDLRRSQSRKKQRTMPASVRQQCRSLVEAIEWRIRRDPRDQVLRGYDNEILLLHRIAREEAARVSASRETREWAAVVRRAAVALFHCTKAVCFNPGEDPNELFFLRKPSEEACRNL